MLLKMAKCHSFLWLSSSPFYIHITFSLFMSSFLFILGGVLGLSCSAGFFLVEMSGSYSLGATRGFLIATGCLAELRLKGTWAQELRFQALEHSLNSCGAWV